MITLLASPVSKDTMTFRVPRFSWIFLAFLLLSGSTESFSQFIQRALANNCVGQDNVFIFTVSGCSVTWGVGGGNYTIISQNSSHIRVRWNSPTTTAYVYANYNCTNYPWSGSTYYPQFTVYGTVAPSVSIVADKNNVCIGSNVTFTATPTNGGPNPNYVWKVNNNTVQTGSSNQYSSTALQTGDVVHVEMASNAPCPNPTGAVSDGVAMTFTDREEVDVIITGPQMPMCGTSGATFVAIPTNGGDSPTYTWYRNNNIAFDNAPGNPPERYTPQNPLGAGDKIKCVMTSSEGCVTGNPATSGEIIVSITSPITPEVGVNPAPISFCEGDQVTFTANEGGPNYTFTTYSWRLNGEPVGTNSDTYVTTEFTPGSVVTVDVTVTGSCISQTTASGNTTEAPIVVKPLPNAGIDPLGDVVIFSYETGKFDALPTGAGYTYVWKRNGNAIPGATSSSYSTTTPGDYSVDVTYDGCTKASPTATLTVNSKPVATIQPVTNVVLPASSTTIYGSGSDSDGTIVAYHWTQQSGPFAAQLANENTNTLSVSNLAGGTYVFRLTVTDNVGEEAYDEVTVNVVHPPNNHNWIRETVVAVPGQENEGDVNGLDIGEKQVTWTYFDGLGRTSQKILVNGSPEGYDIVEPLKYDQHGREVYKFLPYVSSENSGFFKPGATGTTTYAGSPHAIFYNNGSSDKAIDDAAPFSKTIFERSPLNRVLEQGAPGITWQPDGTDSYTSADRTVKFAYEINGATDVLKWVYVPPTTGAPMGLVSAKLSGSLVYYAANQLTRTKTKDENHNEVIEYKDIEGRVVLKQVEAPTGWASTYYVYSDMGDLVCVLPPEAVTRLGAEYHQSGATEASQNSFLGRWAFRYRYDARHRMVQKQVPGAEPLYMVYDKRDRLVLTQDGNQRSGATKYWTFTKYDHLNRPVLTGLYSSTNTLSQMQTAVDNYYANLTGSQAWYESFVGSVSGNVHGYSGASFPQTSITGYLSAIYYDNYTFRSTWIGSYEYVDDELSEIAHDVSYAQPESENERVNGLVTGTKVRVLDAGVAGGYTWLRSVTYYDDDKRPIQTISDNYKGGTDRTSSLYDFLGRVLKTRTTHIERDITWTAKVGVREEGNKLIRTLSGGGWGASGAVSVQKLAAGADGWMEIVTSENSQTDRMVGLSDQNTNNHYNSLDFAWHLSNDGTLRIWESNQSRGNFGGFSPGAILRIERVGSTVKYYHNNVLKRTVNISSAPALMLDVALSAANATVVNARSSFSTQTRTINRKFEYDNAGRLTHTWHQLDAEPKILLAYNEYNELGQLVDKKLHSTNSAATDAIQSVDYRYNIRGWLTSINNAELNVNSATNDETGDLFGMNLAYQDALGTGNTAQYNGNISGMKWSVNQGLGTIKAMAYNYAYDPMNRLTAAVHKQAQTLGTWLTGQFDESGLTYDLNGNIKTLQRKGDNGATIDNLTYHYGSGTSASNKLLYVTDEAAAPDKAKGFIDGSTDGNDYSYDSNGNMLTDKNKGIMANITYNYLNLPELITRGGNSVRYIYDATGRKLAQMVTYAGATKRTDYVGEFVYEDDVLQFVSHEEGRIVIAGEKLLLKDGCENTGNKMPSGATLDAYSANGEKYIKVTANGTTAQTGVFPIGGPFPVTPGQRYRIRAKGYRTGTNAVYLLIKANNTDLGWPGAALPNGAGGEAWIEQIVTIPAGTTTLHAGVAWNAVTAGQAFYLNEFEIVKLTTGTPEYQYHLKDHLGNVRITFTSKDETDTYTATLEDDTQATEQATFKNYSRVTADVYDHTDVGTTYDKAQLLNGGNNSQVGLTKSLAVMPGDTVSAEVYAKYFQTTGGSGNLAGFATALLSAFGLPTPAGGEAGTASAALQSYGSFIAGGGNPGTSGWPKGWLNMLVFDKDYNLVDLAYEQLDAAYMQPVGNVNKLPMQKLSVSKAIKEPGYVYIYISNEGSVQQDVFFDDFKITHTKSPVIQTNDYYPFGLTFNSYSRENSTPNQFLYNGKELQDELDLVWYDYQARQYDPAIGRWMVIDPLLELSRRWSPYTYCYNNPLLFVDPDGMFGDFFDERGNKIGTDGIDDGKVYVVTDKKEAKAIEKTDKAGGTTKVSEVSSATELPSANVRKQMGNAVDRSNAPNESVGDEQGGFHEEGGIYGKTNGQDKVVDAQPGPYADPSKVDHAEVDPWSGETATNYVEEVEGTFHVHPSGEVRTGGGANTLGGEKTHSFDQSPSPRDYKVAGSRGEKGNHYVLGAKGTVTIYNASGKVATFPLKQFVTIGIVK